MLIGSGALFTTGLAGYSTAHSAGTSETTNTKSEPTEYKQKDDKEDKQHEDYEDIPGFDQGEFGFNSDILHLKELAFDKGTLELSVIVTTTDRKVLAEELQALVPGFRQAIREADADEFFKVVEEFTFTLYDESHTKLAAIFLNIEWLRDCLFGDLTNEEFVNRILYLLGLGGNDNNDGPPEPLRSDPGQT